ncbi:MAG: hypothetical protein A2Y07_01235 [Planctomycetes bacterium GWF2_50_10]|nr:MAG: hypothetical protein A2Y07_01235 [Planctomycetes bacterium GWF2_50_10]
MANLQFRQEMITLGCEDIENARELWIMCARDPLFYINTFVWTYDPRKEPSALPMITYDYQDEGIIEVLSAIGKYDLLSEKSRDMGLSWIYIICTEWCWHFKDLQSFLYVSRVQDLVDKTEDPDCLMWKVDFIHKNQPRWLLPAINRNKLHIYNIDNGSTIDGASTTGEVGRGGRRTAILLDEFASVPEGHAVLSATRDTTRCRLFNSTPKGIGTAFYDIKQTGIKKLRFHWSSHPEKKRGLYCCDNGKLVILDEGYGFKSDYPFILDGKIRSPWYDGECLRAAHPMEIAQELDIDYLGSDFQFFDITVIDRLCAETVRPAYHSGEIQFAEDLALPEFLEIAGGRLSLWIHPCIDGHISDDIVCILAVDTATGTGSSNSCISVGNKRTCEKIAEFASATIKPHELARYAVAMARFFNSGFMIWEANGPGRIFGDTVIELGYRNIYYRANDKSISKKVSDVPGWYSTRDTKLALLGDYRKALSTGEFINRSYPALRECREYIFTQSGTVEHARSINTIDPTGARENHGDRCIADALLYKGMKSISTLRQETVDVPAGCLMARRQEIERKRKEANYW